MAEPALTVALALLLLGERLSALQSAGAVLIVGAIAVAALAPLRARRG
jgi:drug/metabolite transporter (DMT)-like permease